MQQAAIDISGSEGAWDTQTEWHGGCRLVTGSLRCSGAGGYWYIYICIYIYIYISGVINRGLEHPPIFAMIFPAQSPSGPPSLRNRGYIGRQKI